MEKERGLLPFPDLTRALERISERIATTNPSSGLRFAWRRVGGAGNEPNNINFCHIGDRITQEVRVRNDVVEEGLQFQPEYKASASEGSDPGCLRILAVTTNQVPKVHHMGEIGLPRRLLC